MHCGDQYPDKPPTIQFISEVNLPCVNPRNGQVSATAYTLDFHSSHVHRLIQPKLPCLAQWKRDFTMETVLIELRR
jgi:ubiquitin-conjugating enzyme E2 variant